MTSDEFEASIAFDVIAGAIDDGFRVDVETVDGVLLENFTDADEALDALLTKEGGRLHLSAEGSVVGIIEFNGLDGIDVISCESEKVAVILDDALRMVDGFGEGDGSVPPGYRLGIRDARKSAPSHKRLPHAARQIHRPSI